MNELATQAANGTNSTQDRTSIQNEIDQLTTEIDRVAETTKFNETYLLKGGTGFKDKYMAAHDAGLDGTIADLGGSGGSKATFTTYVKSDTDMKIAGKDYHIYSTNDDVSTQQLRIQSQAGANAAASVTINGTTYARGTSSKDGVTTVYKYGDNEFTVDEMKAMVTDGTRVAVNGAGERTAVDINLDRNIKASTAVSKMTDALRQANLIGVDSNNTDKVKVGVKASAAAGDSGTKLTFSITKGSTHIAKDLGLQPHVGADADDQQDHG
jgi:flagellin